MINKFKDLVVLTENDGKPAPNEDYKKTTIYDYPESGEGEPVIGSGIKDNEDIVKMSYKNVEMYMENAYHTKKSLLLYGDPGLGKSAIVLSTAQKIAREQNRTFINWQKTPVEQKREIIKDPSKHFIFIDVRTAQLEPSDLLGIPDITNKEDFLEMHPQKWIYVMSRPGSAGILFLDEINQGSPQVLKALYQLVLDRSVGDVAFTEGWGIMAAGNLGTAFNNQTIDVALTNRFLAGVLVADPDSWVYWANRNGVDDSILLFVESRPEENFYKPPAEASSNPFPSPRQFVSLSEQIDHIKKVYYNAKKNGKPMEQSIYKTIGDTAAGLCGVYWAQRFVTFLRYRKLFDWASIAENPAAFIKAGKGSGSADVDKLYQIILVIRDGTLKFFGSDSKLNDKEKIKAAAELIRMLNEFNNEFRLVFINYLNKKDKGALIEWAATVFNNKNNKPFIDEPYKTFIHKTFPALIAMNEGKPKDE